MAICIVIVIGARGAAFSSAQICCAHMCMLVYTLVSGTNDAAPVEWGLQRVHVAFSVHPVDVVIASRSKKRLELEGAPASERMPVVSVGERELDRDIGDSLMQWGCPVDVPCRAVETKDQELELGKNGFDYVHAGQPTRLRSVVQDDDVRGLPNSLDWYIAAKNARRSMTCRYDARRRVCIQNMVACALKHCKSADALIEVQDPLDTMGKGVDAEDNYADFYVVYGGT
ncbi:hypothetical protein EIP86_008139 [Pleurotus ostreatoroseus]|nr:hypothetical protein EIP86_008139 [Pleurotus ostreatoroseus]